ncbi:MAG: hypothetical protein ACRELB_15665, partial [Polyangiaceae bacterium]
MSTAPAATAPRSTAAPGKLTLHPHTGDVLLVGLTSLATIIILAMLVIVLFDVVVGGSRVLSWQFISQAPT